MADPISGELVIVPDAEAIATITETDYSWDNAVAFAAAYDDGTNSDYRLITRAEALAILGNAELVAQLGLPGFAIESQIPYWTIENFGADLNYAWGFNPYGGQIEESSNDNTYYALPIRKVNFYGLPLIDSEFGGGLVFDVVAETRTVSIAAKWADVDQAGFNLPESWGNVNAIPPAEIPEGGEIFTHIPTRAQALKIFGNSYLVTLAGLPVDNSYWTSEEENELVAYAVDSTGEATIENKTNLYYALPVRSEVVPES